MRVQKYKNIGQGWHNESIRHSNAVKFGHAGGLYHKSMGRVCDECGSSLSDKNYDKYGSWNYRCPKCGFRYIHGKTEIKDKEDKEGLYLKKNLKEIEEKFIDKENPNSWWSDLEANNIHGKNLELAWLDTLLDRTLDLQTKYNLTDEELEILRRNIAERNNVKYKEEINKPIKIFDLFYGGREVGTIKAHDKKEAYKIAEKNIIEMGGDENFEVKEVDVKSFNKKLGNLKDNLKSVEKYVNKKDEKKFKSGVKDLFDYLEK